MTTCTFTRPLVTTKVTQEKKTRLGKKKSNESTARSAKGGFHYREIAAYNSRDNDNEPLDPDHRSRASVLQYNVRRSLPIRIVSSYGALGLLFFAHATAVG